MTGGDRPPREDAGATPERRGLDVAREALAAARAAARARGLRPGSPGGTAGGTAGGRSGGGSTGRGRRRTADQRSGARPDDRDPQTLGTALHRLSADRGWEVDLAVGGVLGRWDQVVGARVAEHCRPESFSGGVLVVATDSTAWATQMRLLVPALLRRMEEEVGRGTVREVRVLGPSAPSWKKGRLRVRGRGPRDTYG